MRDEPRADWVSVSQAAAALGTSARTVRRQCAAGTLPARRVGGLWQVEMQGADKSAKSDTDRADKSATVASVESAKSDKGAATNRTNRPRESAKSDAAADTDLAAHLLAEVAFLRATVEQLQRDGAETRAALRAALKLTAGESAPQLPTGTPQPAPTAPPTRAESAADANSPTPANGAPQPAKRDGGPLTYGDIADELERMLNK